MCPIHCQLHFLRLLVFFLHRLFSITFICNFGSPQYFTNYFKVFVDKYLKLLVVYFYYSGSSTIQRFEHCLQITLLRISRYDARWPYLKKYIIKRLLCVTWFYVSVFCPASINVYVLRWIGSKTLQPLLNVHLPMKPPRYYFALHQVIRVVCCLSWFTSSALSTSFLNFHSIYCFFLASKNYIGNLN